MRGDFSRNTFSPKKNYRTVRMQQGRVLLDADWNEMVDIANNQQAAALRSIVGAHGGSESGFKITFAEKAIIFKAGNETDQDRSVPDLYLQAGQYYANGYPCALDESISFVEQPYFPGAADHKRAALTSKDSDQWLLYLTVWERHLTAIEDPGLAEPSLGGADTTTRTQIVWQVKLLPLGDQPVHHHNVTGLPEWQRLVQLQNNSIQMNPGYASENELFRIEIHSGNQAEDGPENTPGGSRPATWKWSRDNASVAFPLQDIQQAEISAGIKDNHTLQLSLATDQRVQEELHSGDCIELDCDDWVFSGRHGWLGYIHQVESPDDNGLQRLMVTVSQPVTKAGDLAPLRDPNQHPLVRRWDQQANPGKNAEGGFYVYKIDSISQLNRTTLEILPGEDQAALYPGDWVDLSGIIGDGIWQVGQVQKVSAEGKLQRIEVALAKPLPDGVTNESLQQKVKMRRWFDEALPVLPNENQALERGITIQFPPGVYRTGDYWLIPMRSEMSSRKEFTVPQAEAVYACAPLALLQRQGSEWKIKDFRRVFIDLGDVFTRLESLQAEFEKTRAELEKTKAWLASLQKETNIEEEVQEEEVVAIQEEVTDLHAQVEELPILGIQQYVGRYHSRQKLEPGDVVAVSSTRNDEVVKANRPMVPIGVVAPRPDDFNIDEYNVVLSGPVMCRITGDVKAGDLLAAASKPGFLEKASFWVRSFQSERIIARAIDSPAAPDDQLINVYFMPDYKKNEG